MWIRHRPSQPDHRCNVPWDMYRLGADGAPGDIWQCDECGRWSIIEKTGPNDRVYTWSRYDKWRHGRLRFLRQTWNWLRDWTRI